MNAMEIQRRQLLTNWFTFIGDKATRVYENWAFFIGPLLTLPLIAAIGGFRKPPLRTLWMFIGLIALLNLFQLVLYPYHLGPVVSVMYALIALGVSRIYELVGEQRAGAGAVLAAALPVCLLSTGALKQNADSIGLPMTYWERSSEPHAAPRAAIERWLSDRSRKQLVVVRYARDHTPNQEWVYNHADIDGSKVVWAREMDAASDAKLLNYFKDREAWLVRADVWPQHVVHYSRTEESETEVRPEENAETPCESNCPN
jgi:hypothetical protein